MDKNKTYKNVITGEKTTAFKYGYEFMLNSHKENSGLADPRKIDKKYIIREGNNILQDNDEWEVIR